MRSRVPGPAGKILAAELPVERRHELPRHVRRRVRGLAVPVLTGRPPAPAGQAGRPAYDRLLDLMAAAAGIWAAVALVLAVLLALAVTAGVGLLLWFAFA
jgi:hypothetical protein